MVYDAVMDVANGIQESRGLWGEAEKNILKLIAAERKRVDTHEEAIVELRVEDQDHDSQISELRRSKHQHGNLLTAIRAELDEMKGRVRTLEERRDTEMRPPPSEPPKADG
jgi:peptidoglycan hydrolase CwlO-like protein